MTKKQLRETAAAAWNDMRTQIAGEWRDFDKLSKQERDHLVGVVDAMTYAGCYSTPDIRFRDNVGFAYTKLVIDAMKKVDMP